MQALPGAGSLQARDVIADYRNRSLISVPVVIHSLALFYPLSAHTAAATDSILLPTPPLTCRLPDVKFTAAQFDAISTARYASRP